VEMLISISSSRREIAGAEIQRIAAEAARIFSTFSPALHLGRWN